MSWKTRFWQVPLGSKPQISQMGIAVHGRVPAERYLLPRHWCVHIYRYDGELKINDGTFPIRPGHASVIPPGSAMEYRYRGKSVHVYAHFALPEPASHATPIAAMQDLGKDFAEINRAMEQAVECYPRQRLQAEVRIWDVLWRLAGRGQPQSAQPDQLHPAVQNTIQQIELRLHEPIYVTELVKEAGVSQNHLIRLFRATMGTTVVGYIRDRRLQRASHLLRNTTLPIKTIAHEIGIPDLHLFNKMIRGAFGMSPRKLRSR